MRDFEEIYSIASQRKGGAAALEGLLSVPLSHDELARTSDSRWLSAMAKCIFQAGFNWKVIENKWEGFEAAFDSFDPSIVAFYGEDEFDSLLRDERIVRNGPKIAAVIENARLVRSFSGEAGTAGAFVANWPGEDIVGLLTLLNAQGSRLGGLTAQRMLRMMGRDSFILSADVTSRLVQEGVIDKPAASKGAMSKVQSAFNAWSHQSGRSLTQISQVLAYSV